MKSIIVGTAGHIDHGKTALVKALTGIDADRLQEEKRRGITIDLGFAHLELPGTAGEVLKFGFVDVPGHERFVRNMLAGVGGIDLVLLVIAADEGIKPQTREHFDICRLQAVQHGITVLTKSDLVDQETLEVVRLEVADFLRGSFLEKAPIIPVSSLRGAGLDDLKRELVRMSEQTPAKNSQAITRLPIDRVFTMKGFGTVVTGTLVVGTIRKEDEMELFPATTRVRVRGVQVHGAVAECAVAGERTALNLAGLEKHELERGMVLASPGLLQNSSRMDVRLSLLASAEPLKNGARVHFHAFASETIATVNLFETKQLAPGAEAFAQLRLSTPLLLVPGDRFIIRQFSPGLTVGGGVVLDSTPLWKVSQPARLEFLKTQADGNPMMALFSRIRRAGEAGTTLAQLVAETGQPTDRVESLLSQSVNEGSVVRRNDLLMDHAALSGLVTRLQQLVSEFHNRNPLVAGISKESLREQARISPNAFEFVLLIATKAEMNPGSAYDERTTSRADARKPITRTAVDSSPQSGRHSLAHRVSGGSTEPGTESRRDNTSSGTNVNSKALDGPAESRAFVVMRAAQEILAVNALEITGDLVHLPGRGVVMKDEEAESRKIIEQTFAAAGLKVPALKDVLAGLKIDKVRAQKIMTLLLREKTLIKVSDDLVFHQSALAKLRKNLAAQKQLSPRLDVGRFKALTGVSRKYAIPLLEYLDRERVTRRAGEERVIL